MEQLQFARTRDVKSPVRGTGLSAGIDFFVPADFPVTKLWPQEAALIPLGLKLVIPRGHALVFMNKSGVAIKKHLQVSACVIDEDYQGEPHAHLTNIGPEPVDIRPGEKIIQGLVLRVNYCEPYEVMSPNELQWVSDERGEGGFGSTNDKQ